MDKRDSLKNLPGVGVVVEDFRSVAEDAGFDRQAFQTDVELKLRMAGIHVMETGGALPVLYVNVNVLHQKAGENRAFSINVAVIQEVVLRSQLCSDPERSSGDALANSTMNATTWSIGATGFGAVADVRNTVKDLVDNFANDWLAVNPRNGTA